MERLATGIEKEREVARRAEESVLSREARPVVTVSESRTCDCCGKGGAPLVCTGCKIACYCDAECQKRDWKRNHKSICPLLKNAEAELFALKDMDGVFRSLSISLE